MKRSFADLLGALASSPEGAVETAFYLLQHAPPASRRFIEAPGGAHKDPVERAQPPQRPQQPSLCEDAVMEADWVAPADGQGFTPSPWQADVLRRMDEVRQAAGHAVGLLVLATGIGKTVIAILDVERAMASSRDPRVRTLRTKSAAPLPPVEHRQTDDDRPFRLLFLVHSRAIADGACAKFKAHFGHQYPARCFVNHDGKRGAMGADALFVFALFQSFAKLEAHDFSHLIVDEVHHVLAVTYRRHVEALLGHCNYALGMTATLQHRDDPKGVAHRALFRDTVYIDYDWVKAKATHFPRAVEYLECLPVLADGRDVPTYQRHLAVFLDTGNLQRFLNDLQRSLTQLGMDDPRAMLTPDFVANTLLGYQRARRSVGLALRTRVLVFVSGVKDAARVAALLADNDLGLRASSVSYQSQNAASVLERFAAGHLHVLVSCNMISEGFDVPACDLAVLARPTESEIVYSQQLGRVLRGRAREVAVLDLALNLRRRWHCLRKDITDAALKQMIAAFYPVDTFWPPDWEGEGGGTSQ